MDNSQLSKEFYLSSEIDRYLYCVKAHLNGETPNTESEGLSNDFRSLINVRKTKSF